MIIPRAINKGSDEWFASRLGRPSASMFNKLITSAGKASSQADGYINDLIEERLKGVRVPIYVNQHMEGRGTRLENEAREHYEFITEQEVTEYGFILDDSEEFGCSPDGFVGEDGGLEIKCPTDSNLIGYLCSTGNKEVVYRLCFANLGPYEQGARFGNTHRPSLIQLKASQSFFAPRFLFFVSTAKLQSIARIMFSCYVHHSSYAPTCCSWAYC